MAEMAPPEGLDLLIFSEDLLLNLTGHGFDEIGSAERIDRIGDSQFMGQDLLDPYGNLCSLLSRSPQDFVIRRIIEKLNASQDIGQCGQRDSGDIIDRARAASPLRGSMP